MAAVKQCKHPDHRGTPLLPATLEFFSENKKSPDGLVDECLVCQQSDQSKAQAVMMKAAWKTIAKQAGGGKHSPHMSDLTEEVVSMVGGVGGIAKTVWEEFAAAAPGGAVRKEYLKEIIKLICLNTEKGYADKPVEEMSDEELGRFILEQSPKYLPQLNGKKEKAR